MFAGNFAPRNWALCNGQILPISQNTALFSILGTTYGGNGQTTFALPDLRSRVPVHPGQGLGLSPYTLGQQGGTETVTLLSNQMPAHTHLLACNGSSAGATSATNNFSGSLARGATGTYAATSDNTMNPAAIGVAGGSQPHENLQPFLAVNFIIATSGLFPSRN